MNLQETIRFAEAWASLGDRVIPQVEDMIDEDYEDVNPEAIRLAKEQLSRWFKKIPELEQKFKAYDEWRESDQIGRTHYRNGDEIGLPWIGCDGCNPSMINGVLCHESGCPDKWRDTKVECAWCGTECYPIARNSMCCSEDCALDYFG